MLTAAVVVGVVFFRSGGVPAACAGTAAPAVQVRFLLVGDAGDPAVEGWESAFALEGVPYERVPAADVDRLRLVAADGAGEFAATVVANSGTLTPKEDARLSTYEQRFGLRRIIAIATTSAGPVQVPVDETPLSGRIARLTAAGRALFPYLRGPVPIDGATGRPQTLGAGATSLVSLGGASLLTEWRRADGVDELLMGVRTSPHLVHELLLAPGMIAWALNGVVPGSWRPYFDVDVDDILLPSFTWIEATKSSGYASGVLNPTTLGEFTVRMTPADLAAAATWERQEHFTLDMGLNGYGLGYDCDSLARAVTSDASDFRWFNHTYQHLNFDNLPEQQMVDQIVDNVRWAKDHGVGLNPRELVTGQQSGLHNPQLPAALRDAGVRVIASDASRDPVPKRHGDAVALPRHPMNVYQDAATRIEEVEEYDARYHVHITWPEFVQGESTRLLRLVLENDPRPSYAHESNLAKDRILLDVLTTTLDRYRNLVRVPFAQPTMTGALDALVQQRAWWGAVRRGAVSIVRRGSTLTYTSKTAVDAPLTVDSRTQWIALRPGHPTVVQLP